MSGSGVDLQTIFDKVKSVVGLPDSGDKGQVTTIAKDALITDIMNSLLFIPLIPLADLIKNEATDSKQELVLPVNDDGTGKPKTINTMTLQDVIDAIATKVASYLNNEQGPGRKGNPNSPGDERGATGRVKTEPARTRSDWNILTAPVLNTANMEKKILELLVRQGILADETAENADIQSSVYAQQAYHLKNAAADKSIEAAQKLVDVAKNQRTEAFIQVGVNLGVMLASTVISFFPGISAATGLLNSLQTLTMGITSYCMKVSNAGKTYDAKVLQADAALEQAKASFFDTFAQKAHTLATSSHRFSKSTRDQLKSFLAVLNSTRMAIAQNIRR